VSFTTFFLPVGVRAEENRTALHQIRLKAFFNSLTVKQILINDLAFFKTRRKTADTKTSALYNGLADFVDGLTVCSSCQQNANKCDISNFRLKTNDFPHSKLLF